MLRVSCTVADLLGSEFLSLASVGNAFANVFLNFRLPGGLGTSPQKRFILTTS